MRFLFYLIFLPVFFFKSNYGNFEERLSSNSMTCDNVIFSQKYGPRLRHEPERLINVNLVIHTKEQEKYVKDKFLDINRLINLKGAGASFNIRRIYNSQLHRGLLRTDAIKSVLKSNNADIFIVSESNRWGCKQLNKDFHLVHIENMTSHEMVAHEIFHALGLEDNNKPCLRQNMMTNDGACSGLLRNITKGQVLRMHSFNCRCKTCKYCDRLSRHTSNCNKINPCYDIQNEKTCLDSNTF